MNNYKEVTSRLYRENFSQFQKNSCINGFVHAIHCRLPFEVSFLTSNLVSVVYSVGGHSYLLNLEIREFDEIMSYALMHIDDIV